MLKIWKKTKSEERKTPLTANPLECIHVDLFCRNICCALCVRKITTYSGISAVPV